MPHSPESLEFAERLIAAHGARALQVLVDEIVAAVRSGNDMAASDFDRVLRAVEHSLARGNPPEPRSASRGNVNAANG